MSNGSLDNLPWRHNIALLDKLKDPAKRLWYAEKTIENGWSQPVLVHHIEKLLHERQGKAITNFSNTLPSPQSDLAQSLLKDPYSFDFLTLAEDAHERHLEAGLLVHITELLTRSLPDNLKNDLPTIEELESEAAGVPFPEEEGTEKTNGES